MDILPVDILESLLINPKPGPKNHFIAIFKHKT